MSTGYENLVFYDEENNQIREAEVMGHIGGNDRKSVLKPGGSGQREKENNMPAIDVFTEIKRHGEYWINMGRPIYCPECGAPRNEVSVAINTSDYTDEFTIYELGGSCMRCQCNFSISRKAHKVKPLPVVTPDEAPEIDEVIGDVDGGNLPQLDRHVMFPGRSPEAQQRYRAMRNDGSFDLSGSTVVIGHHHNRVIGNVRIDSAFASRFDNVYDANIEDRVMEPMRALTRKNPNMPD